MANGHPPVGAVELVRVRRSQRRAGDQGGRIGDRNPRTAATAYAARAARGAVRPWIDPGAPLARRLDPPRRGRAIAGDGVVGATGLIEGRPVACYAQDGAFLGGSLGERHADTIVRVLQTARRARIPVVAFVESGGARMQEGTAALAGYGRIFRETVGLTGEVPADLDRLGCFGRRWRLLARADRPDRDDRGCGDVPHGTGSCPRGARRGDRRHRAGRPAGARAQRRVPPGRARRGCRGTAGPRAFSGTCPRGPASTCRSSRHRGAGAGGSGRCGAARAARAATTCATRWRGSSTLSSLLELAPRWARNVVTALARIDGRPVGIVANQPRYLGGVLDAAGSEKAARFVGFCDSFGLPLVAVVDTPGFMPGSKPGAGRRDPPRRVARAGVRRRVGAEADGGPAQVLRRRLHHDELA